MKRSFGIAVAAATLGLTLGCGLGDDLSEVGEKMKVIGGDTDPSLLGTYRLFPTTQPAAGMFTLLVLDDELRFHGQYVAACPAAPCPVVEASGNYEQRREMPNLARAAGVILRGVYHDPVTGGDTGLAMILKRGLVEGSPLVSLYHDSAEEEGGAPFFMFIHEVELFCRAAADCERQGAEKCAGTRSCESSICRCQ